MKRKATQKNKAPVRQDKPRVMPLEEAIRRSLPLDTPSELRNQLIDERPGYFGLHRYCVSDKTPLEKLVPLQVDIFEWLAVYESLLANPENIDKYARLLDSKIVSANPDFGRRKSGDRQDPETGTWPNLPEAEGKVKLLFGIQDHSDIRYQPVGGDQHIHYNYVREKLGQLFKLTPSEVISFDCGDRTWGEETWGELREEDLPASAKPCTITSPTLAFKLICEQPFEDTPTEWSRQPHPDGLYQLIHFTSNFQMPSLRTGLNDVMFQAFKRIVNILIECKGIAEFRINLGDGVAMTPTFRR